MTSLLLALFIGAPACADLPSPAHSGLHAGTEEPSFDRDRGPRRTIVVPTRTAPPTPFGFWGLNGFVSNEGFIDVRSRFGISVVQTASTDPHWVVNSLLPMAEANGLRVMLRLTGDHPVYSKKGNFDLQLWKASLEGWTDSGVQPFIDNGTLAGHMLLDDIDTFSGHNPTADELDEMAAYSKSLLPGLMTFVRQKATEMPQPADGRYHAVDAVLNQYKWNDGDAADYATRQSAAAEALDVGVIMGMNIADGGDGSSARAGYRAGYFAMSADEITRYGTALASAPAMGMFLCWEYDGEEQWADGSIGSTYFDQPELQSALLDLGKLVAVHPPVPLLRE